MSTAKKVAALVAAVVVGAGLGACSDGSGREDTGANAGTLTMYSGQHEELATALAAGFEEQTGIHIAVRAGKDAEMVGQIIEEGQRSKADVVLTEEPGPIGELDTRGLLAAVPAEVLEVPDHRFVPSTGNWLPWAARSRVLFYNPDLIAESDLPTSILDLADSKWSGQFAYAPSGAFKSTTAYLINTVGAQTTLEWLAAIRDNGTNEQKNGKVRDSVEAGQHPFGLSNHYYWYILARDKGGPQNLTSRVAYLNNDDAGALMLASGAGVLRSSPHQQQAQQFLAWLADRDGGQRIVAEASPQFPLTPGVDSDYPLPSLTELTFPDFDQASLQNVDEANALLVQSGII
ncbi:extracellular solute-binding protein [Mycolicibacillus parakoreensis]|uniref:Extracellular solute-binding protein n=1 Tax=Mycolicibacillus parakoreensis TaxID=1069221 RepID=A0ABY3U6H4_9MYCO|nr:extracellular solute-binding protein [Mycolicibacillus parakoreensis]MCV7313964.1 extracellular solute-binding protein [Mycolicibacillus parakoreensis]ULN54166.1 extracellular solute-binding protein [Mycolicibacillus parakoreensis]